MRIHPNRRKIVNETSALTPALSAGRGCVECIFCWIDRAARVLCVKDAAMDLVPAMTMVAHPLPGERAEMRAGQHRHYQRDLSPRKYP